MISFFKKRIAGIRGRFRFAFDECPLCKTKAIAKTNNNCIVCDFSIEGCRTPTHKVRLWQRWMCYHENEDY
jgi:hypothetical protein